MKRLILIGLLLSTAARATMPQMTPQQFTAQITPLINAMCVQVNATQSVVQANATVSAVPKVAGLLPYVTASCVSPDAIAALIAKADLNTYSWLYNLDTLMFGDLMEAYGAH